MNRLSKSMLVLRSCILPFVLISEKSANFVWWLYVLLTHKWRLVTKSQGMMIKTACPQASTLLRMEPKLPSIDYLI